MSINEKMTALAGEIRELSGTTTSKSIDTMTSDINTANAEITEQTDLIAQIASALEGKAGSPSGEDVTAETEVYTIKLTSLETAVTALEAELAGKASGGNGGGSVETCTVSISGSEFTSATITIYFLQSDGNVNSDTVVSAGQTATLSVTKGFIIVKDLYSTNAIYASCSEGINEIVSVSGCLVFNVTKDGTISIF